MDGAFSALVWKWGLLLQDNSVPTLSQGRTRNEQAFEPLDLCFSIPPTSPWVRDTDSTRGDFTPFGGPGEQLPTRIYEGSEEVDLTKKEE